MATVDFILNLAALLLWINWRAASFDPLNQRRPATLIGTLRRTAPSRFRRWHLPTAIGALVILRALLYWQIGPAGLHLWSGKLDLGVIVLAFASNSFVNMLAFSFFSFALALGIFYSWLLLLSILAGPEPLHRLVKIQLGPMDNWPRGVKFFLPLLGGAVCWWLASWPLAWLQIIPPSGAARRLTESLLIGLGGYLAWEFLIVVLLAARLLHDYIYFGKNPFWHYVGATTQTLLLPLKKIPLRAGRMDFAPVAGILLIGLLAKLWERGLDWLFTRLPF